MTGERDASRSKSSYTHEACTQVGVHGEENANESSGQVDKLCISQLNPWEGGGGAGTCGDTAREKINK